MSRFLAVGLVLLYALGVALLMEQAFFYIVRHAFESATLGEAAVVLLGLAAVLRWYGVLK